ncbi:MAG: hypothetical protein AB7F22_30505 [Reyranella sp.]|uniref:hypothetical protein n=1 Tax=Reyranella sp. TaxID=1929291 RepID=UPI003D100E28
MLLAMAVLAGPALGQTRVGAQATNPVTCGALKGESSRNESTSQWTISGPSGKTTETGVLKSGPRFECLDGAILTLEFASTAGHGVFEAYFPDGTTISYGRQQINRRGGRVVLPIQAKARIAAPWRAAFDYHCRLDMPADPIPASARGDCIF